ncbi:ATPase family protein associated with various cellular activities (AAA) [Streptomyces sp. SLBN-118]|nr:ATP-binding protein [Streptomyces sp. SLBN-118]TQK44172.1 ATPase family protein associated with various cellular activities (AAA) [Streptomyces sp. SLBN-118]
MTDTAEETTALHTGHGTVGLVHLIERIRLLEGRIRRTIDARRQGDPDPGDPFRGTYLSDDVVQRLLDHADRAAFPDAAEAAELSAIETRAAAAERDGADVRLRRLQRDFGLDPLDVEVLLFALAPDLDNRLEHAYAYLNDDVTRRRASIAVALELCGVPAASAAARARLGLNAPLISGGLLRIDDAERPFLSRTLRVPDRVTAHLLGDDGPDARLADVIQPLESGVGIVDPTRLAAALASGMRLAYLRECPGGAARLLAASALAACGSHALGLDLGRAVRDTDPGELMAIAAREARLTDAALVAGPVEATADHPQVVRRLAGSPVPVLLVGSMTWDPAWAAAPALLIDVPPLVPEERITLWRAALGTPETLDLDLDLPRVTAPFLLAPDQVARAAQSARQQAALVGGPVTQEHLRNGARTQSAAGLEKLARRIEPAVGWEDLVLPPTVLDQLSELASRARHREQVLGSWGMRPGGGRGRGVMALFAGDSGTGKTMSAEVIAAHLGLDLYTVDLAMVVDKYVGETEKNLERIFTEAAGVNGVLLFDEADAIFGKRSEVKDAHDRYANVESAYLLQRMESFDGLAILATNLRANLDEAFTRRLDLVVDFPTPDQFQRRALWDRCLGTALPREPNLDLDFCASAFELAGGNIRSIAVTAAYLAADVNRPVCMTDLVTAVQREYRKLGRLCLESEFGPYFELIR